MAESLAKQAVDTKHYVVWICTPAHQATKPECLYPEIKSAEPEPNLRSSPSTARAKKDTQKQIGTLH